MYTYVRPFWLKILIPAAGAKTALAAGIKLIGQNALTQVYYYGASESEMVRHVPNGPMVQKLAVLALAAGFKIFGPNRRGQVYVYRGGASF